EIDIELYFIELRLVHDRALLGFLVERITEFQLGRLIDEALDEIFESGTLHKHARAAQANLTLVRERRAHAASDGSLKIGIGKDDIWVLTAQLERNLLEQRRARLCYFATRYSAAGERDRIDLRMRPDRGADICSGVMHDIEHAIWQTGF